MSCCHIRSATPEPTVQGVRWRVTYTVIVETPFEDDPTDDNTPDYMDDVVSPLAWKVLTDELNFDEHIDGLGDLR